MCEGSFLLSTPELALAALLCMDRLVAALGCDMATQRGSTAVPIETLKALSISRRPHLWRCSWTWSSGCFCAKGSKLRTCQVSLVVREAHLPLLHTAGPCP